MTGWGSCAHLVTVRPSEFCAQEYAIEAPIEFLRNSRALDELVDGYFDRVKAFKIRHGYPADGRINQTKIAALMVETILSTQGVSGMFAFPDVLVDSIFPDYAATLFAYRALCTFLFVTVDDVPEELELDIKYCLRSHSPVDESWLVCWAATLYDAYGDKQQSSVD